MKTLLSSMVVSFALMSGTALAQTSGQNGSGPNIMSDTEQQMMKDNPGMMGFFNDDKMMEMKGDDDITKAYGAMSDDDRSRLKAACSGDMNEASFSRATISLCAKVNAM